MRCGIVASGLSGVSIAFALMLPGMVSAETAFEPDAERAQALIRMVRQDCGSCHGLTLQGGLGPALTAQALEDKPFEFLFATLHRGRPGTPMPPFLGILTEQESAWIVHKLVEGFPEDGGPLPPRDPEVLPR